MSKANVTELLIQNYRVFYSYQTPVIAIKDKFIFVNNKKYSSTTSKQITKILSGFCEKFDVEYVDRDFFIKFNVMKNSKL